MSDLTIAVTERAGVGGAQLVTLPVPVPREAASLYSDGGVHVRDANRALLPSSARVVSHWEDGTPRWALVRTVLSLAPNERRSLTVLLGQDGATPAIPGPEPILGAAGRPGILSATNSGLVSLAGEVKRGDEQYGMAVDTTDVVENSPLARVLRLRGTFQTAGRDVWVGGDGNDTTGPAPQRQQPLRWTLWAEAFAGMPGVRLRFRLENWGGSSYYRSRAPANDTFFDGLRLVLTLTRPVPKSVWVQQRHEVVSAADESRNFYYVEDGRRIVGRHPGEFALGGGTLAVRRFWQEWPKAVSLSGSMATIELWPAGNRTLFIGVWSKCHDFALGTTPDSVRRLLTPPAAVPDVGTMAKVWRPLGPAGVKDRDPEVTEALARHTRWVTMLVDPAASDDRHTMEAIREHRGPWRIRQGVFNHYGWQEFGDIWHSGNPGTPSNLIYDWPWIAWLHHVRTGDARLRSLAEEFTDHSRDLDLWKAAQPDGTPIPWGKTSTPEGVWNWETNGYTRGAHFGPLASTAGSTGSHTWNSGYLWGYWLTGDETYREAVLVGALGLKTIYDLGYKGYLVAGDHLFKIDGSPAGPADAPHNYKMTDCTRCLGWSALLMANAYRLTGEAAWLDYALRLARNLVFMEQLPWGQGGSGGKGYIPLTGPYTAPYDKNLVIATFGVYHLEPLCEVHSEAQMAGRDMKDIEDFLLRSVHWLKTVCFRGGVSERWKGRIPWQISYRTDPMDPDRLSPPSANDRKSTFVNNGGELGYNGMAAGAAAYVSTHILHPRGETAQADEYLRWAKELFRDDMLYSFPPSGMPLDRSTFISPSLRGKIGWTMNGWPAVSPKLIGWRGRSAMGLFEALARTP